MTETFSAGGKIDSLKLAASEAVKPPAGMIEVEGRLQARRSGCASHDKLRCWNNHRLRSKPGERPIETVMRCGVQDKRLVADGKVTEFSPPCEARLYVILIRSPVYLTMDVNTEEHNVIEFRRMKLEEIIEWFGITLPPPAKR